MTQILGLFPTPVMRVEQLLGADEVDALVAAYATSANQTNAFSDRLSHTAISDAGENSPLSLLSAKVRPKVAEFGELLFGEELAWQVKEMWVNVLEPSGRQAVHTHANSFISGVVYLTDAHPSANLVFHKSLGGTGFIFGNNNRNARINAFNAGKFQMPETKAGDLVMFPSYLLHEVPQNQGERRISVAFNAVPDRLDNFGYAIRFS